MLYTVILQSIVQSPTASGQQQQTKKLKESLGFFSSLECPLPVTLRPSASFPFGAPRARFWAHLRLWTWTFGLQWPDFASPPGEFTQSNFRNLRFWFRIGSMRNKNTSPVTPWPKLHSSISSFCCCNTAAVLWDDPIEQITPILFGFACLDITDRSSATAVSSAQARHAPFEVNWQQLKAVPARQRGSLKQYNTFG